jgi:hypothetical protein
MTINVAKLHQELVSAGIPIDGVSSNGRIDFQITATEAQRARAQAILLAHDPVDYDAIDFQSYKQQIKAEYVATLATLADIENAISPTNAQVIAAVKFMAKTLRLILKLQAKMI